MNETWREVIGSVSLALLAFGILLKVMRMPPRSGLGPMGSRPSDPAAPFTGPGERRWSSVMKALQDPMEQVIHAFSFGTSDAYGKACVAFDDALSDQLDRVTAAGGTITPARNMEQFCYALERCIAGQEAAADRIDKANPGDPYASLMVRDDIDTLSEGLAHLRGTDGVMGTFNDQGEKR